jgi:hypothetical protein
MPFGGALSLGMAAVPGALQVIKGIHQNNLAKKVQLKDTTPLAFREELANSRLAANNQRVPGQGAAIDRINQGVANGMNNAVQAGTGSAGILASLGRLDQNRNNAFLSLSNQAQAFQQQNQNRLSGNLRQQAAYQKNDQDAFNREKAGLKEGASRNIFGGVSTMAGAGVMAATGGYTGKRDYYKNVANGTIPAYPTYPTTTTTTPK